MPKAAKFILNTFLKLTSMTYPYGYEDALAMQMIKCGLFPKDIKKDAHGNYYRQIGDSRTIFASHLDTVSREHVKVTHVFEGDMIKTDGTTTLGADDKAGVTIMLWMMKNNVPGMYYFFIGEEVGCIGSGNAAKSVSDFKGKYDRIISFDRRGTESVITHQSWSRCCSSEFGDALAAELGKSGLPYKKDDGGVYTDSAEFVDIIPECTNISVGYYKEHTTSESQDIKHLQRLAEACLKVEWESLPTKRDPKVSEYKSSYGSYDCFGNYGSSVGKTSYGRSDYGKKKNRKSDKRYGYHDDWHESDDWNGIKGDAPGWDDEDYWKDWDVEYWNKKVADANGKSYYDKGGELVDISGSKDYSIVGGKNDYEWIMSKFVGSRLTIYELAVIRDQYLDMSSQNDRMFYEYLAEYVSEQNQ